MCTDLESASSLTSSRMRAPLPYLTSDLSSKTTSVKHDTWHVIAEIGMPEVDDA